MAEIALQPRILKVFLASPSDVIDEREALSRLVRDINDALAFLAPEKRLSLELVRYATHAYPDIGQPQEVINRQIPLDYDIFIRSDVETVRHSNGDKSQRHHRGVSARARKAERWQFTSHNVLFLRATDPRPGRRGNSSS